MFVHNSKGAMLRMPFFIEINELSIALVDISRLKANPVKILVNGDWMLSQSRTTSSRRCDLEVLGTAELSHRTSISWPTMRGRDVSKRNLKELIHDRFQRDPTCRDSQLETGWTEETCIAMDKLAREDHSYCPLPEEFDRYRKKCINETPIRLPRSTYKYATSPP